MSRPRRLRLERAGVSRVGVCRTRGGAIRTGLLAHDNCLHHGGYNPRLAQASLSPHTRRAYAGALRRLGGRELDDGRLAAYLAELFDAGRAARRAGSSPPNGPMNARPSTASSPSCSSWPGYAARKPRRIEWRDFVADAQGDDGLLVGVRRGKTNPRRRDSRRAFCQGRGGPLPSGRCVNDAATVAPTEHVIGLTAQAISERFAAAARAAGALRPA